MSERLLGLCDYWSLEDVTHTVCTKHATSLL